MAAAGYVKITDRTKDVIKTGGEWISSLELEDVVAHHGAVSEVAVIGQPDNKWGELPLALVVCKPDIEVSEKEIIAHTKEFLENDLIVFPDQRRG